MKIIISRFGPIKKFSFDLEKDVIVIYGNNNIGKSYAMQVVYLLLKTFINHPPYYISSATRGYMYSFVGREFESALSELTKKFETTVCTFASSASHEKIKSISNELIQGVYDTFSALFLDSFLDSCKITFGNFERILDKEPLIEVQEGIYSFVINLKEKKINGTIQLNQVYLKKTESDFHKSRNAHDHLDIYVVVYEENKERKIEQKHVEQAVDLMFDQVRTYVNTFHTDIRKSYDNVYFLPASRSGIYSGMSAFGAIVAELSRKRAFFTRKIELPGLSEPISDYFISLSNINRTKANDGLECVYSKIEEGILKGTISIDKQKNALVYKPNNLDVVFDMTEVSSMVSEVSPIIAFLKYIINTGRKSKQPSKSILFIEEPEAHLHPNNQISFIEMLVQLIEYDIKLIMSSHSNYVFNKLNNLVLGEKLNYEYYEPIILRETEEGSDSQKMDIDELGAEDQNFISVGERLFDERESIIERLNTEE